jgi:hypothetical protein
MWQRLILVAIGVAALASTAATAKTSHHRGARYLTAPQQQQVACTVLGCIPVPRGCSQTYGRTPSGIPTGYDVILCPPGIWPLK